MLETRVQEKLRHDRDSVVTYAAKPAPDRKPYTSKLTVQDKAFQKELEQMRAYAEAVVIHTHKHEPHDAGALNLRLDDFAESVKPAAVRPQVLDSLQNLSRPHVRKPPMKITIEEWDGDGAIRIPDEALQELELDVGDAVYLIEDFFRQHAMPSPIKNALKLLIE